MKVGRLAVVSRPDPDFGLPRQLQALRTEGLDVLVSMLQHSEANELGLNWEAALAREAGLEFYHLPTDDFGVPISFQAAGSLIVKVATKITAGRAAGVHCYAGRGRSPLFASAVLVQLGTDPEAAIEAVSQARGRRTPETEDQRRWVGDFAAWRRGTAA
jgi:protein-tyrosine phosphatase